VSANNLAEISVPVAVLAAPTDGIDKYEDLLASRKEVHDSISCNFTTWHKECPKYTQINLYVGKFVGYNFLAS
jgi:hypothetical protein